MNLQKEPLAWAAGLFEGEGAIYTTGKSGTTLALAMTDEDVVKRFSAVIGLPIKLRHRKGRNGHKDVAEWRTAKFEYAQAVISLFWSWFGQRRKLQAKTCLLKSIAGIRKPVTQCPQGHLYTTTNTYVDKTGSKVCKTCRNTAAKRWYKLHKNQSPRQGSNGVENADDSHVGADVGGTLES